MPLAEHRKDERYSFESEIIVDDTTYTSAGDISSGGLFIKANVVCEVGSTVSISMPDYDLEIEAEVRFCKPNMGAGLKFIFASDEQQQSVLDIITRLRDEAGELAVKPKVLLIEPQSVLRTRISQKLMEEGFSVAEASDGMEAVKQMNNFPFHAVIMELKLPKIDGLELLEMIRTAPDHKDKLVLVMSKNANEHEVDKALGAGADHFVPETEDLMETLLNRLWTTLGSTAHFKDAEPERADPWGADVVHDAWSQEIEAVPGNKFSKDHDDMPPLEKKPSTDPWEDI